MRLCIAEHAVLQPRDGVQQGQRRQLTARQNEVAKAQLYVDVTIEKSLIDALVSPAKQHGARPDGEFSDHLLIDPTPRRREVNHRRTASRVALATRTNRRERALEWLGEQNHPGPAAIGTVVDAAVMAIRKITQRPQAHVNLRRLKGPAGDAVGQVRREELGEKGDDVKPHGLNP